MKAICFYPIDCAMHGAIQITTRRLGYITVSWLQMTDHGRRLGFGLSLSPNATPWGATLLLGSQYSRADKKMARLRRVLWGHGYSLELHDPQRERSYLESFAGELPSQEGYTP